MASLANVGRQEDDRCRTQHIPKQRGGKLSLRKDGKRSDAALRDSLPLVRASGSSSGAGAPRARALCVCVCVGVCVCVRVTVTMTVTMIMSLTVCARFFVVCVFLNSRTNAVFCHARTTDTILIFATPQLVVWIGCLGRWTPNFL